mmetsp:Transcript_30967/g.88771  ORF Transcript_30967/g.88771 Transcript_30967/m.88771 type:complete len:535 (+) Transcript_30967:494-2098(+)
MCCGRPATRSLTGAAAGALHPGSPSGRCNAPCGGGGRWRPSGIPTCSGTWSAAAASSTGVARASRGSVPRARAAAPQGHRRAPAANAAGAASTASGASPASNARHDGTPPVAGISGASRSGATGASTSHARGAGCTRLGGLAGRACEATAGAAAAGAPAAAVTAELAASVASTGGDSGARTGCAGSGFADYRASSTGSQVLSPGVSCASAAIARAGAPAAAAAARSSWSGAVFAAACASRAGCTSPAGTTDPAGCVRAGASHAHGARSSGASPGGPSASGSVGAGGEQVPGTSSGAEPAATAAAAAAASAAAGSARKQGACGCTPNGAAQCSASKTKPSTVPEAATHEPLCRSREITAGRAARGRDASRPLLRRPERAARPGPLPGSLLRGGALARARRAAAAEDTELRRAGAPGRLCSLSGSGPDAATDGELRRGRSVRAGAVVQRAGRPRPRQRRPAAGGHAQSDGRDRNTVAPWQPVACRPERPRNEASAAPAAEGVAAATRQQTPRSTDGMSPRSGALHSSPRQSVKQLC